MKIMLSTLRLAPFSIEQSVKLLLAISMITTLSACSSIRYNGFSDANTIFDVFSFSENEQQAVATAEDTAQQDNKPELAEAANQPVEQKSQPQLEEQPAAQIYQQLASGEPVQENSTESSAESAEETATKNSSIETAQESLQEEEPVLAVTASEPAESMTVSTEQTQTMLAQHSAEQTTEVVQSAESAADSANNIVAVMPESAPAIVHQDMVQQDMVQQDIVQQDIVQQDIAQQDMAEQNTAEQNIAAIDEVNRMTEQNPTAAMVSDYKVLPEVSSDVADLSVPNEILLLASSAEYRPEVSEYGMWKIAKGDDSLYRENCTLASATMQVSFENYSTQVWLNVVGNDLLVNATTNIDINRPRVGIKLDNGPLQSFSKKHFNTSAVWSGNLNNALKRNKKLSVVLSGNELGGRIQEVTVELDDLKRAYSEYTKCNATTQIGSL